MEDDKDDKDSLFELKAGAGSEGEAKDSESKDEELGGSESKDVAGPPPEADGGGGGGGGEGAGVVAQEAREEEERSGQPEGGATAAVTATCGRGAGDSKDDAGKAGEAEDKGAEDLRDSHVTEGQDATDAKQVRTGGDFVYFVQCCPNGRFPPWEILVAFPKKSQLQRFLMSDLFCYPSFSFNNNHNNHNNNG